MYLSEMIDAVESKTGEELFPQSEVNKAEPTVGQVANIPKATETEPVDDPPEPPSEEQEEKE